MSHEFPRFEFTPDILHLYLTVRHVMPVNLLCLEFLGPGALVSSLPFSFLVLKKRSAGQKTPSGILPLEIGFEEYHIRKACPNIANAYLPQSCGLPSGGGNAQ